MKEEAGTIAAGEEVWEAILQVRREGTAPAPDEAIFAAGALCSLLQDRAKHLCAAILNKLQDWILSPTYAHQKPLTDPQLLVIVQLHCFACMPFGEPKP